MFSRIKKVMHSLASTCSEFPHVKRAEFQEKPFFSIEHLKGIRIFATTVLRGSDSHDLTGFILELDWQNNRVKEQVPIPLDSAHPFWNARGGNRGGRGVFVHDTTLYVATAMSVLMFDSELKQIGELTHPYLAGLHEIYVDSEGIWLTSTVHDLVVKLDFDGNVIDEWWGSESQLLQQAFGFTGRNLDLEFNFPEETFISEYERYCKEERLHANTVWPHKGGIYVLACREKAFIRIRPEPERIILYDSQLGSPHNSIVTPEDHIIINDTQNELIRTYDLSSGRNLMTLSTPIYEDGNSKQFAKAGWQRGLAHVEGSVYLVGTSPATIFEVDIDKGVVGQICRIDTDVRHCIHGLTVVKNF